MAYMQSAYPTVAQGIPPTRYTIAQIGCFITSFCNLESRFGVVVDPPAINAFFRDNNLYIDVDDGHRDDVSWDFVTKYDPNTTVTGVGGASTPPHNNSIVKFVYGAGSTHFCLVNDVNAGTIIDSWDGKIKPWSFYGGVKAWASYNNKGVDMDKADLNFVNDVSVGMTGLEAKSNPNFLNNVGLPKSDVVRNFLGYSESKRFRDLASSHDKDVAAAGGDAKKKLDQIKQIANS